MNPILLFILIFIAALIAFLYVLIYLIRKYKEKKKYVIENSVKIKNLVDENKKYQFKRVIFRRVYDRSLCSSDEFNDFNPEHWCKVYINHYKLECKNAISQYSYNITAYPQYKDSVNLIDEFEYSYDYFEDGYLGLTLEEFKKIEKKIFSKKIIRKPFNVISIKIYWWYKSTRHDIDLWKNEIFKIEDVMRLLNELENKNEEYWNGQWERGKMTAQLRYDVLSRDGFRCVKCGSKNNLEVDHIKPISKGGKTEFDNLQTLCRRCNSEKGSDY